MSENAPEEEYATPTELGNISEDELPPEPGSIEDDVPGVKEVFHEDGSLNDGTPPVEENSNAEPEVNDDEDVEDYDDEEDE